MHVLNWTERTCVVNWTKWTVYIVLNHVGYVEEETSCGWLCVQLCRVPPHPQPLPR